MPKGSGFKSHACPCVRQALGFFLFGRAIMAAVLRLVGVTTWSRRAGLLHSYEAALLPTVGDTHFLSSLYSPFPPCHLVWVQTLLLTGLAPGLWPGPTFQLSPMGLGGSPTWRPASVTPDQWPRLLLSPAPAS